MIVNEIIVVNPPHNRGVKTDIKMPISFNFVNNNSKYNLPINKLFCRYSNNCRQKLAAPVITLLTLKTWFRFDVYGSRHVVHPAGEIQSAQALPCLLTFARKVDS